MERPEPYLEETSTRTVAKVSPCAAATLGRVVPELSQASIRRLGLVAVLTGIFSFGAAVGLFATAWAKKNPRQAAVIEAVISGSAMQAPAANSTRTDNASQQEEVHADKDFLASQSPIVDARRQPAPDVHDGETLPDMLASVDSGGQPVPAAESPAKPAATTAPPPPVPASVGGGKLPHQGKAAKTAPKDREIERIKRQAGEELKGKTSDNVGAGAAAKGKPILSKQHNYTRASMARINKRVLVAQCEQVPNLIQRERCKWDLCNGTWGKDGCPSYDKPRGLL